MILFLHSLLGTPSLWLPHIRGILNLESSYSDRYLIDLFTFELPGHPDNDRPWTLDDARAWLRNTINDKLPKQQELAKKLILTNKPEIIKTIKDTKLTLIGHELGAVIALEYALQNIPQIQRLVLIGCGNSFNHLGLKIKSWVYSRLYSVSPKTLKQIMHWSKKPRHKNFWSILSENLSREAINSGLQILSEFNFSEKFQKLDLDSQVQFIRLPLLLMRGQFDWICPVKEFLKLAEMLDSSKEIWQKRKSVIDLGKVTSKTRSITYKLTGGNIMDTRPVEFVLDVREFIRDST